MRSTPLFTAAMFLATPAIAKTPDGLPPSVETVCDEYRGAAYGLCNAYCEAMDCDHPDVHASSRACAQVSSKFERITGDKLVCDPGGEDACTVTAVDDEYYVTNFPDDDQGVPLYVLENDTSSPDDAALTIVNTSADPFHVEIDASGEYLHLFGHPGEFTYEVCCDEATCDTASVLITS